MPVSTRRTPESRGFDLTVDDAADLLSLSHAEVLDLVRLGILSALSWSAEPSARPRCHLASDEVDDFGKRRAADDLLSDEVVRPHALATLRAYFAKRSPTPDYERAIEEGRPLWASAKGGARTLNVRVESVLDWHRDEDPLGTLTISALTGALEQVGALRTRGLVPFGERGGTGKQRWPWWWRVPLSMLPPADGDDGKVLGDVVSGVREQGEKMSVRGAGRPFLVDPLDVS